MENYTCDGWVIDADLTMREVHEFQKLDASGSDTQVYPWLARMVKVWPFEGDPTKPDTYENLKLSQFGEVMQRVQAAFQHLSTTAFPKPAQ